MGASIVGVRAFNKRISVKMREHEIAIKTALAIGLSNTRVRAAERIIPNRTSGRGGGKIQNPYFARKQQPNTAGRLTSRTGKLKLMLGNRASASNPLNGWKNIKNRNKLATQNSTAFKSQVRIIRGSKTSNRYEATIRVKVTGGDQRLFATSGGQPQESLRTLAVRFNWETGIRGQKRPIFRPVIKLTEFDVTKLVAAKDAQIWGR